MGCFVDRVGFSLDNVWEDLDGRWVLIFGCCSLGLRGREEGRSRGSGKWELDAKRGLTVSFPSLFSS